MDFVIAFNTFVGRVGETFTVVDHAGAAVGLVLAAAEPLSPTNPGSFVLRFDGPTPALPQRTYPMRNDVLGNIALFIVPIAGNSNSVTYEAVFNTAPG